MAEGTSTRSRSAPKADDPGTLTDALARIMDQLGRIEKKGTAPAILGGFPFVRITDVQDKLQALLTAERIMLLPRSRVLSIKEGTTSTGKVQWLPIIQLDLYARRGDEEILLASVPGMGQDTADKGISKAVTSAVKQALLHAFMVPTGDDPDAADHEPSMRQPQGRQQARSQRQPAQQAQATQPADSGGSGGSGPSRQDLVRAVSTLIRRMGSLGPAGQKIVNVHSIRNHIRKGEHGEFDDVGPLLQQATPAQIIQFGQYLRARIEEAIAADAAVEAQPATQPAGTAETMTKEEALAAGTALLGD